MGFIWYGFRDLTQIDTFEERLDLTEPHNQKLLDSFAAGEFRVVKTLMSVYIVYKCIYSI